MARTATDDRSEPGAVEPPLLSYLVGRLDRALRTRLVEILTPLGLTVTQFTTLSVLRRRSRLSNAQLARRALIAPQSMIQVLAELEQRGLVRRAPAPTHARILEARLTRSGTRLVGRAEKATSSLESDLIDELGDELDLARVTDLLQRWSRRLANDQHRV